MLIYFQEKALTTTSEVLSTLKGSFFFNGENVISHQYSMVLNKTSKLKISLQVSCILLNYSVQLVSDSDSGISRSTRLPKWKWTESAVEKIVLVPEREIWV